MLSPKTHLVAMVQLDVRALVLHDGGVTALQVVLLERRWHTKERRKVRRVQPAELLGHRKRVDESRLAALDRLIEAQRVQELEPRGRLVVRQVQVVLEMYGRVRNVHLQVR